MPRAQPYEACLLRKTLLGVCHAFLPHERLLTLQIGTLRSNDEDNNENVKKNNWFN